MKDIQVLIMMRGRDFGRCVLGSNKPLALWSVADQPALMKVLQQLARQGIGRVVICASEKVPEIDSYKIKEQGVQVDYWEEELPWGTAGCIREVFKRGDTATVMVLPGNMTQVPCLRDIVNHHQQSQADLTVLMNMTGNSHQGMAAGIYVCSHSILPLIPAYGYCDIKESLIPTLLQKGKRVFAYDVAHSIGTYRSWTEYLDAVSIYLQAAQLEDMPSLQVKAVKGGRVWRHPSAQADASAVMAGTIVMLENAVVEAGAVLLGPCVIGRGAHIGRDCLVTDSVLWDQVRMGQGAHVRRCLLAERAEIPPGQKVDEQLITPKKRANRPGRVGYRHLPAGRRCHQAASTENASPCRWNWMVGLLALATFLWCYKSVLADLLEIWRRSDEYSSGLLVPFLAIYVAWIHRRDIFRGDSVGVVAAGVGALGFFAAQIFRLFGGYYMYASAERLSMLMSLMAIMLILYGGSVTRRLLPWYAFLGLMLPLPKSIENMISLPLQAWATTSAVYLLESCGLAVVRDGNVIHLGDTAVAVAEACNGLRMITAFFIISGFIALLVKRRRWEKMILLFSAMPIGMLCNTLRLAVTAVAFTYIQGEEGELLFHDFGGYAMMPVAVFLIIAELWLMKKVFMAPGESREPEVLVVSPHSMIQKDS